MGVEKDWGSIEVGKLADLAVLSQEILTVPPEASQDAKALMAIVGGDIIYRSGI